MPCNSSWLALLGIFKNSRPCLLLPPQPRWVLLLLGSVLLYVPASLGPLVDLHYPPDPLLRPLRHHPSLLLHWPGLTTMIVLMMNWWTKLLPIPLPIPLNRILLMNAWLLPSSATRSQPVRCSTGLILKNGKLPEIVVNVWPWQLR